MSGAVNVKYCKSAKHRQDFANLKGQRWAHHQQEVLDWCRLEWYKSYTQTCQRGRGFPSCTAAEKGEYHHQSAAHAYLGIEEAHQPALVFLTETRLSKDRALGLQRALGFPNGHAVPAEGLSGGLALFWRRGLVVVAQTMSRSHIDVVVSCDELAVKQ